MPIIIIIIITEIDSFANKKARLSLRTKGETVKNLSEGNIYKSFILFALPLIGAGLFSQFYSVFDTVIAGKFLGEHGLGAIGATADFCLAELDTEYVVDAQQSVSKSHNCVFDGRSLYGKIVATVVNGELKYEE